MRADGDGAGIPQSFHEILIDEYQDSNLVQEYILSCISGEEEGRYNRFMVGDVKQSIYKFRLARPELFLENMRNTVKRISRKNRAASPKMHGRSTCIRISEAAGKYCIPQIPYLNRLWGRMWAASCMTIWRRCIREQSIPNRQAVLRRIPMRRNYFFCSG